MLRLKKLRERVRTAFVNNKSLLIHSTYMLLGLVAVSVVALLLLMLFDVVYFEDGMHFNSALFLSFKSEWYGWIIFIVFQTVLSMLLCAIPGAAMAFTLLSMTIYTEPWQAFLISFAAMLIASSTLYAVGRSGGYRLCARVLGDKDCDRALTILRDHGTVYFPLVMMFPTFPDEALTMIAGTLKMSLKWFVPSIVIGRGIGIAFITFGISAVPFDKFTSVWHWVLFVGGCIFLTFAVLWGAHKINVHMESKRREKAQETEPAADAEPVELTHKT